jgi:ABC-type cobalamin transport system ATPase subunit
MNTKQQIEFLKAFIIVWDEAIKNSTLNENKALQNILTNFCNTNKLPVMSADELLYKLQHPTEHAMYFPKKG